MFHTELKLSLKSLELNFVRLNHKRRGLTNPGITIKRGVHIIFDIILAKGNISIT